MIPTEIVYAEVLPHSTNCECGAICKKHSKGERKLHDLGETGPRLWKVVYGKYRCRNCRKIFSIKTPMAEPHSQYTRRVINLAIRLSRVNTLEKTSEILLSKYYVRVPITTLHDWIAESLGKDYDVGFDSNIIGKGK